VTKLSVNLNKIALVRNSREGQNPDLLSFVSSAIEAGASGITLHPRPDQRHIRPSDVTAINNLLNNTFPQVELNIEGNPFAAANDSGYPGFDELIEKSAPDQVTLVPDNESQLTSDHGWELTKDHNQLVAKIEKYRMLKTRVSLFLGPDVTQIRLAKEMGADRIELYTGPFAKTFQQHGSIHTSTQGLFDKYCEAATFAGELGLGVNAGHDLNLNNLRMFSELPYLSEVSIGHAIVVDALNMGFTKTMKEYLNALQIE